MQVQDFLAGDTPHGVLLGVFHVPGLLDQGVGTAESFWRLASPRPASSPLPILRLAPAFGQENVLQRFHLLLREHALQLDGGQGFHLYLLSGHCTCIGTFANMHLSCTYELFFTFMT